MTDLATLTVDALQNQLEERELVGCLLEADEATRRDALAAIEADAFTDDFSFKAVWAIRSLVEAGKPVEVVSVLLEMAGKVDGQIALRLNECAAAVPSGAAWPMHWEAIQECRRRRRIAYAADAIATAARDLHGDTGTALSALDDARKGVRASKGQDAKTLTRELLDDMEARHKLRGALTGISYGLPSLDRMTDGIQAGEYIVLGARPSIGKTAIAVTMMATVAVEAGIPCTFLSLETRPIGIHRRLMANVSGVSIGAIRSGSIEDHWTRLIVTAGRIAKAPIRYHYGLGTMDGHAAAQAIRQDVEQQGTRVVFLDYLQHLKVDGNAEKRTYGIAANSAEIKRACDETGVAVVALAQLARIAEDDDRLPKLSDIAECGQIERDADTVMLLHRKREETVGDGVLIVAKARDGECGAVGLHYHGPTLKFTERSKVEEVR